MSKPQFVLDYEGVILNSLYEKFVVGFNAHLRLNRNSTLLKGEPIGIDEYQTRLEAEPDVYEAFRAYVPLIGDLGENSATFKLIEAGERIGDRESFIKRISQFGKDYLRRCSEEVLRLRQIYAESSAYAGLCPPFQTVVQDISELADLVDFTVCTTKPLENVEHCNKKFGLERHIAGVFVCDNDCPKVDILKKFALDRAVDRDQIGFIDDFARHLIPANAAGFYCLYANWGFGGPGDKESVSRAGIKSVTSNEFAMAIREFIANHELRMRVC